LPPLRPSLGAPPVTAQSAAFVREIEDGIRAPLALAPLGHDRAADGPAGLVSAARPLVARTPSVEAAGVAPPTSSGLAGVLRRIRVQRAPRPAVAGDSADVEPSPSPVDMADNAAPETASDSAMPAVQPRRVSVAAAMVEPERAEAPTPQPLIEATTVPPRVDGTMRRPRPASDPVRAVDSPTPRAAASASPPMPLDVALGLPPLPAAPFAEPGSMRTPTPTPSTPTRTPAVQRDASGPVVPFPDARPARLSVGQVRRLGLGTPFSGPTPAAEGTPAPEPMRGPAEPPSLPAGAPASPSVEGIGKAEAATPVGRDASDGVGTAATPENQARAALPSTSTSTSTSAVVRAAGATHGAQLQREPSAPLAAAAPPLHGMAGIPAVRATRAPGARPTAEALLPRPGGSAPTTALPPLQRATPHGEETEVSAALPDRGEGRPDIGSHAVGPVIARSVATAAEPVVHGAEPPRPLVGQRKPLVHSGDGAPQLLDEATAAPELGPGHDAAPPTTVSRLVARQPSAGHPVARTATRPSSIGDPGSAPAHRGLRDLPLVVARTSAVPDALGPSVDRPSGATATSAPTAMSGPQVSSTSTSAQSEPTVAREPSGGIEISLPPVDGPAADAPVQRAASASAGATAETGGAGASGGGAKIPTGEKELDELAVHLYDRLRSRLRRELLVDRERAGALSDVS
jgi:hypothetical protein